VVTASKTLVVGLTGFIGAGKSTVAELLSKKGVPIIDADALGRDVLATSSSVKKELRAAFGPSIFTACGDVDRNALARAAFASEAAAGQLNAVVHPPLWERIKREVATYEDADVVVIDAALIVEWGTALPVEVVVVVDAPEGVREQRSWSKYGEEDFYARQSRQFDDQRKRARADVIVDNSGSLAELAKKVDLLYGLLLEMTHGRMLETKPLEI
jgi:dephospho-CoA kinase